MTNLIEPEVNKATIFQKILAWIIDFWIIFFLMIILIFLVLGSNFMDKYGETSVKIVLLFALIVGIILFFSKDSYKGISIGRWIMGTMVRNDLNKQHASFISLFIRNIFTIIWPVELIILIIKHNSKRIGDNVTKTVVLKNPIKTKLYYKLGAIILFVIGLYLFAEYYGEAMVKNTIAYNMTIECIEQGEVILEKTGGVDEYIGKEMTVTADLDTMKVEFEFNVNGKENNVLANIFLEKSPYKDWVIKEIKVKELNEDH